MSLTFTKLFSSITESTIWLEPMPTRIVWITMLAMSDRNGFVFGSMPGLAHRARVSIDECRAALRTLLDPDPESRTAEHEGRRIVVIDGGWELLNYAKYRAIKDAESVRESKRNHMRRVRESGTSIPQWTLPSASSSGSDLSVPDPDARAETIVVNPKRGTFAPDDFEPNDTHRVRCQELQLDIAAELRDFKLHEFNRPYSDWGRRFSKWLEETRVRRETERAKARGAAQQPRGEAITVRDDRGGLLVLEPSQAHRAYAAKHGLDLAHIMNHIREKRFVETLGLERARECIKELLVQAARKKGKPNERTAIDRRPDPGSDRRGPQPRQTRAPGGG